MIPFGSHWRDLIPYFAWLHATAGAEWVSYTGWPIR